MEVKQVHDPTEETEARREKSERAAPSLHVELQGSPTTAGNERQGFCHLSEFSGHFSVYVSDQCRANFFCKGPESKYLRHCGQ